MANPIPNVPQGQKKPFKGPAKPVQNVQSCKSQASCGATPQSQAQKPEQVKPQAAPIQGAK
jgi:hypothetical protein